MTQKKKENPQGMGTEVRGRKGQRESKEEERIMEKGRRESEEQGRRNRRDGRFGEMCSGGSSVETRRARLQSITYIDMKCD